MSDSITLQTAKKRGTGINETRNGNAIQLSGEKYWINLSKNLIKNFEYIKAIFGSLELYQLWQAFQTRCLKGYLTRFQEHEEVNHVSIF